MDSNDPDDPNEATRRALLSLIVEDAGAKCGIVFAQRGEGLAFVAQCNMNQRGMDLAYACWARRREDLKAGRLIRYGGAVVWPLFQGPELAAFIYLDQAHEKFPGPASQQDALRLLQRMADTRVASPAASYLAAGIAFAEAGDQFQADQLAMALESTGGNVTAAAGLLQISRETVYARAEEHDIDIDRIRDKRREQSPKRKKKR